jgi:hypothetical protein
VNLGRGKVQGGVFGFDVHSIVPFRSLRRPIGAEPLEVVVEPLAGTTAKDDLLVEIQQPGFLARIYKGDQTFWLWVASVGWFHIDPRTPRITMPPDLDPVVGEELLLGMPMLLCFLHRGDASLHAAAIEVAGRAILLVGPQGRGKSTLAAGFARRGYRVLSEDLACIRPGPSPSVIPGPATLRLRNDVAAHITGEFGRLDNSRRDRTRYALRADQRGDCQPVPIRAVVVLGEAATEPRLDPVKPMVALPDLWQASVHLTRRHDRLCFECLTDLVEAVPIFELRRPLTIDELDATIDCILAGLSESL